MNLPAVQTTSVTPATVSFNDLLRQADVLAQSRIIPASYRNRAPDVVAAGLAGQAFGWDVMTSLRNYHVIEGTASLRPEAMLGLVRRAGHSVTLELVSGTVGGRTAVARGKRADTGDEHMANFSEADAKRAGLAKKRNWEQYLDAMLTWRAVSQLCRVLFPDVVLGAGYTPEEIGAEVTESGDVAEPDPFDDPLIPVAEAKRRVLEICDGDKEAARSWWETQPVLPGPDGIRESALDYLLDHIASGIDIEDAVVVPDAHLTCDRCGETVENGAGSFVCDGTVRVCHECDNFYCQACGTALEDDQDCGLCDACSDDSDDGEPLRLDGLS